ncbi:MAG TPA: BON domain-containing protein [Gaiellaceae bacterium]|nr:BON domain-containing protein [Gaiellaceae bacterium]
MRLVTKRRPSAWEPLRTPQCAASFLAGVAVGEAGAYFFDSERGHRRRRELVDRAAATGRRTSRHGGRALRHGLVRAQGRGKGLVHRVRPRSRTPVDDTELAHKVESIVFRDGRFPKGRISVNAERGEVFLRGELEREELIVELVEAVRKVPGVRSVANLLHLPGTPAPASVTEIHV